MSVATCKINGRVKTCPQVLFDNYQHALPSEKKWNEKIINKLKRQKLVRDSNGKDKDENLMSIPKIYIPGTKYQEGYTKLIKQI